MLSFSREKSTLGDMIG
jgi:hypothetical protein